MAALGGVLLGIVLGGIAVWFVMRERVAAALRTRGEQTSEFQSLAGEVLKQTKTDLLDAAELRQKAVEELVKPIKESLEKVGSEARELEKARVDAYARLTTQVGELKQGHDQLRVETGSLVTALRAPAVRGRWGELQLRRVVEAAGMLAYCDFVEQTTVTTDDGRLRPDLIVKLPGGRNVVVDAKTPLHALLDAHAAESDEERERSLVNFVRHVRDHVAKLGQKAYWQQFDPTPDFVLMFVSGESFYRAALERDGSLLELGLASNVIIASPSTLIALLRTIAVGWREERLAESATKIRDDGRRVYEALATLGGHFAKLGSRLDKAVEAYNDTVGSLETRVLPAARRFPELGVPAKDELLPPPTIERVAKPLTAAELTRETELTEVPRPGSKANAA